jgi:hypothetical protein
LVDTDEVFSERDRVGWAGFVEVVLVLVVLVLVLVLVVLVLVLVLVVLVLVEVVPVVEPEVVVEVTGGAATVVVVVGVVPEEEVAVALVAGDVEGAAVVTLELTQPVNAVSVVTEQASAEALPVTVRPNAAATAPASDAARALTRRSVILVRTDILRAARGSSQRLDLSARYTSSWRRAIWKGRFMVDRAPIAHFSPSSRT